MSEKVSNPKAKNDPKPHLEAGKYTVRTVVLVVTYVLVSALTTNFLIPFLDNLLSGVTIPYVGNPGKGALAPYGLYINILLALAFGYLIVWSMSWAFYWHSRIRYDHYTSLSVRNVVRIIGLGSLAATVAGGVAGGTAGVALGGFLALVTGFATQNVLSQAVAGLFILLGRPFKHGDKVGIGGDTGIVREVALLYTYVDKGDGTVVLIPNGSIIGNKIYVYEGQAGSTNTS